VRRKYRERITRISQFRDCPKLLSDRWDRQASGKGIGRRAFIFRPIGATLFLERENQTTDQGFMVRRAFCRLRRAALTLTLLLVSQLSLGGQACLMAAPMVAARALSTVPHAQSQALDKPSIGDAGCCVEHDAREMTCTLSGETVVSTSFPSNWPTLDPVFPGGEAWPGHLATAQLGCLASGVSVTAPHPPFPILFCRYLN
jgi:hypothetical protein